MPNYRVLINDNAHYMDEGERADHGVFANGDEAVAACKEIVDDELNTMWKPGMTAKELYRLYVAFPPSRYATSRAGGDGRNWPSGCVPGSPSHGKSARRADGIFG